VFADKTPAPRRKTGLIVAGIAGAALLGGGLWFALRGPSDPAVQPSTSAPTPPPPPPAVKRDIELRLTATPKAEVYAIDGRLLGETPYTQTRAPAEGKVVLVLRAEGYRDLRVTMPADHDDSQELSLEPVKPAVVATPTPPVKTVKPAKPAKPGPGSGSSTKPPDPPGMGGRL